jgi:transposase
MSYVWKRAERMAHLSMNQTAQGLVPAAKRGHHRDVWQKRILEQYPHPLHQLAVRCDMDVIRIYDQQIEKLDRAISQQAKRYQSRDDHLLLSSPGIGRVLAMTILFEIDTIDRFPTVNDFTSYCHTDHSHVGVNLCPDADEPVVPNGEADVSLTK